MIPSRAMADALWSFWRNGRTIERAGYVTGALLLASGVIHLAILLASGGAWDGPLSMRKAVTFGVSFGVTVITIVWVTSWVRLGDRMRAVLLGAFTTASVVETALVTLQAWRGVPSHFNVETPFDAAVAGSLAIGGVSLVLMIIAFTIASFRGNPPVPISISVAIRIGFVILVIALAVGGVMIARGMQFVTAGDPQAAYATGGAFKPIHGVTMHAILVLPMLAWLLSFADWTERRRLGVVLLAAAAYIVIGGVVSVITLAALAPPSVPIAVGVASALVVAGMTVSGARALR